MHPTTDIFEVYNGALCVQGGFLYKEGVLSFSMYKKNTTTGLMILKRRACKKTPALIEWRTMPENIKTKVIEITGFNPESIKQQTALERVIRPLPDAAAFFANYRLPNGKHLEDATQREYLANAEILTAVLTIAYERTNLLRKLGQTTKNVWFYLSNMVNELDTKVYPHKLPTNERRLHDRARIYNKEGYTSLIHKNFCNQNSAKITGEVANWLVAYYSLPTKPTLPMLMAAYNEIKHLFGWCSLDESAVNKWLNETAQKRIWTLGRHGEDVWSNTFGHTLSREKSNWFPNSYWAIDGTKLDFVYMTDNGVEAKLRINALIDAHSEKIIGWSLSMSESHVEHFEAVKMAVKHSGVRPYLLTYDNQSGHKSHKMRDFYTRIVATGGTHYSHKAYSSSSPVEQIFNRLQQQCISTFWFSDKQGIKVRREDNKPNTGFIKEFSHRLPKKEDIIKAWELVVSIWNNGLHPDYARPRNEVYTDKMPMREEVSIIDMVQLFCVEETKPKIYYPWGMPLTVGGVDYKYEVYDGDGNIDLDFRANYVREKLIVRYAPDSLDTYIGLYELTAQGDKRFVAYAEPKRQHEVVPVLMDDTHSTWSNDYAVRNKEIEDCKKKLQAIRMTTGITPEKVIDEQEWLIKTGGRLPKSQRNELESIIHDF